MQKHEKSYNDWFGDHNFDLQPKLDIINEDDKDYYDGRLFNIILPGTCLFGIVIYVYANDAQTALEKAIAYCEKKNWINPLYEIEEVEPEYENQYIYVDATMEGASKPYYVSENLYIKEV